MNAPTAIEWVSAIANVGTAVAVIVGVVIARQQLNSWRSEARERRRADAAEKLIAAAYEVDDILKRTRSRFDSIPQDKVDDKIFPIQRRYDRLFEASNSFEKLRRAQIAVRTLIGSEEVDQSVQVLFSVRGSVFAALEELADFIREGPDSVDREFKIEMRRTAYGSYDDNDKIGQRQVSALETIEKSLMRYARLEHR